VKNTDPVSDSEPITVTWRKVVTCVLITLVGFNLRSVILGVPPVLPLIQHDLGLSYTATGFLTALPVLALAVGAWPSGLLAERIGARLIVSIGLALLGAGALLRAFRLTTFSLFFFTLLLSAGIALTQTAVPVLIRRWFPKQIGLVSALFGDGLIIGEAVAAGVTVLIMVRFLGGDAWAGTFVFWGTPVVVLLACWLWLAPAAPVKATRHISSTQSAAVSSLSIASPIQRKRVNALHLGILVGGGSLVYFGMNAWIPPYNQAIGAEDATPLALGVLNAIQLPVGLLVTVFAQRLVGRRWPFVAAGALCLVAILGLVSAPIEWQPFWAACLGGGSSFVFALGIGLPALLFDCSSVARLTGVTLTLSYGVAFLGPLLGGAFWDMAHRPQFAFIPIGLAGLLLIVLGAALPSGANFGLLEENAAT